MNVITFRNSSVFKKAGLVIETDHNLVYLEVNLEFSETWKKGNFSIHNSRAETIEFTKCFEDNLLFELQGNK